MDRQEIRDKYNRIRGYIEKMADGAQRMLDQHFHTVGCIKYAQLIGPVRLVREIGPCDQRNRIEHQRRKPRHRLGVGTQSGVRALQQIRENVLLEIVADFHRMTLRVEPSPRPREFAAEIAEHPRSLRERQRAWPHPLGAERRFAPAFRSVALAVGHG